MPRPAGDEPPDVHFIALGTQSDGAAPRVGEISQDASARGRRPSSGDEQASVADQVRRFFVRSASRSARTALLPSDREQRPQAHHRRVADQPEVLREDVGAARRPHRAAQARRAELPGVPGPDRRAHQAGQVRAHCRRIPCVAEFAGHAGALRLAAGTIASDRMAPPTSTRLRVLVTSRSARYSVPLESAAERAGCPQPRAAYSTPFVSFHQHQTHRRITYSHVVVRGASRRRPSSAAGCIVAGSDGARSIGAERRAITEPSCGSDSD